MRNLGLLVCWYFLTMGAESIAEDGLEQKIYLNLACRVETLYVNQMTIEGPREFRGWEGGYNVGDTVALVALGTDEGYLTVTLIDPDRKRSMVEDTFDLSQEQPSWDPKGVRLADESLGTSIIWSDQYVELRSVQQRISLKKYPDSNWKGFLVDGPWNELTSVTSFSCETRVEDLASVINLSTYK